MTLAIKNRVARVALVSVGFAFIVVAAVLQFGCAMGRGADGKPVYGFSIGPPDPKTINELAALAAPFAGPYAPLIFGAGGVISLVAGLFAGKKSEADKSTAVAAASDKGWAERDDHQAKIDDAYDEGHLVAKSVAGPVIVSVPSPGAVARDAVTVSA